MTWWSYLIAFLLLVAAELVYFRIAGRFKIIDKPNERSSHKRVTLRGGGIIFYMGIILCFLFFGFHYPLFFTGLTLIAVISLLDDVKTISSKIRITVHFAAMLLMFADCGFYGLPWYFTLIALIVATGIINAYNFMDGINGITGGYSLAVIGSLWYVNHYLHPFTDNNLLIITLIALVVFNIFNFRTRARCFAGDVGAVSMAFIIVFLLGKLMVVTADISFILLLAVYGVDSVLTIIHRLLLHENIFEPHRKHAYQIMANELKVPHVWVSSFYMLLQTLVSSGYFITPREYRWYFLVAVLALLCLMYVLFMKKYFGLHGLSRQS